MSCVSQAASLFGSVRGINFEWAFWHLFAQVASPPPLVPYMIRQSLSHPTPTTPFYVIGTLIYPFRNRSLTVTLSRTDGFYRREPAGTLPVVLKVARITGAVYSGNTMEHLARASRFSHALLVQWTYVIQTFRRQLINRSAEASKYVRTGY